MESKKNEEGEEVARLAGALRTAIRLSEISHRHIERELRLSTGYLTRILKGDVELRVSHVLSICKVIGLPVGNFLTAVFPATPPGTMVQARLVRGLTALQKQPDPPRHSRDPETLLAEFRDYLQELREVLDRKGQ